MKKAIIEIPGLFYCKYDGDTQRLEGFGFMPNGSATPDFHVYEKGGEDMPELAPEELERFHGTVWSALRDYLSQSDALIEFKWEEDGWSVPLVPETRLVTIEVLVPLSYPDPEEYVRQNSHFPTDISVSDVFQEETE